MCEQCHASPETVCHALWECPKIAEVWEAIQGFEFRQLHNFQSFKDLVVFVHGEGKNLELMAMVLWTVWHRRNQIRVGSRDFSVSQVILQAMQALTDFKSLNASLPPQRMASGNSQAWSQWSPPPRECFKINFDGATFPDLGKAGLGVVIRNCTGNVVASLLEQAPLPFSPVNVEAMATARAIQFAQELGVRPYILEGDAEVVINSFKSDEDSLSTFGHIISSAKSTLVTIIVFLLLTRLVIKWLIT